MRFILAATLAGVAVLSLACQPSSGSASATAQATPQQLCEVKVWQRDLVAQACKPGQKLVFLRGANTDENLPAVFAAVNCDLRHHVVMTPGAVSCIYQPLATPTSKS